jgi:hypothetical protein
MNPINFYIGLFSITSCTLMLQVIQTRILSVVAWYHLAFFAISMAMFGLTAGAVWVYLRRDRFTEMTLSYDLSYYSSAFALSIGLCLIVQMTLAPVVIPSVSSISTWTQLALCLAIPFYFSGIVVSLALTRSPFPIGRVYAVDLMGASVGCLGVLILLDSTDGPSAIFWVAAIAAAGALFFYRSGIGTPPTRLYLDVVCRHRTAIFVVFLATAIINGLTNYGIQPLFAKGALESGNSHIFRKWNSFSRIAVYPLQTQEPQMWGPSPKLPGDLKVSQRLVNIDGQAATIAYGFNGKLEDAAFLKFDVTNLAYNLPDRNRIGIIGVGGGRDILSAAVFGSRNITGVEINPIFVKLLTKEPGFTDFTNLTQLEGVKLIVDEGRSWFARSDQKFDVIQMSLIDTWAATGAGAFTLSENGLYTVEAWLIFLERLSSNGVFTVSRWYNKDKLTETGRMVSLAVATLLEMGIREPAKHIYLASSGRIATLIVARQPFSISDLAVLDKTVAFYEYSTLLSPTLRSESETLRGIVGANTRDDLERYTSGQVFDLTPATDDRPFFFNQLPFNKPLQVLSIAREIIGGGGVRYGNLLATVTLLMLFFVSLTLVVATIVIPLRLTIKDVGRRFVFGGTLYFLLIGVGFMAVEIALLQRMSVFLGHPIYSLSVLLFTLILATGIGSLLSDRVVLDGRWKFALWALMTGGYILALPFWLPGVLLRFDSVDLISRGSLCVATITPAGLLMGFGFPTGMRLVSALDRKPTPWFWGINGAAGVLSSVVAVSTSIAVGISGTLIIGAVCYFLLLPTALIFAWSRGSMSNDACGIGG